MNKKYFQFIAMASKPVILTRRKQMYKIKAYCKIVIPVFAQIVSQLETNVIEILFTLFYYLVSYYSFGSKLFFCFIV